MDSPGGSELFESYEQDYEAIKVSITERLNASGSQNGGNDTTHSPLLPSLLVNLGVIPSVLKRNSEEQHAKEHSRKGVRLHLRKK